MTKTETKATEDGMTRINQPLPEQLHRDFSATCGQHGISKKDLLPILLEFALDNHPVYRRKPSA